MRCFLLVLETVLPKAAHRRIPDGVDRWASWPSWAVLLANFDTSYRETFNGLLMQSPSGQVMRVFFLVSSIFVSILARVSLPGQTASPAWSSTTSSSLSRRP